MKRLQDLSHAQLEAWRQDRMEVGKTKYGDSHLGRYGAVDIVEELLDAQNILDLIYERVRRSDISLSDSEVVITELVKFRSNLMQLVCRTLTLDQYLEDAECTDEKGGDRIWWGGADHE